MILNVKLNGIRCTLEIDDADFAAAAQRPVQLNQKQAAKFLGISLPTFRKRSVKKNALGKYSVEELRKVAESRI